MIASISALFEKITQTSQDTQEALSQSELKMATAALLIEGATIDRHLDEVEIAALGKSLCQRFSLGIEEVDELIDKAKKASHEASSLYQFTQLINQHCNEKEKYDLTCSLWEVAYADDILDKYEEHIIRRIADLIHVRHIDFIRAKQAVRDKEQ
jgi:uncharacterized tellurite resistance protein B-like protein